MDKYGTEMYFRLLHDCIDGVKKAIQENTQEVKKLERLLERKDDGE